MQANEQTQANQKKSNFIIVLSICSIWLILCVVAWFKTPEATSESERRKLAQAPELKLETVANGTYMKDFETYAQDQFPLRFPFRQLKAYTRFYGLRQLDSNEIYVLDGFAAKQEYPLKENEILLATTRIRYLYEKYLEAQDLNVFISVIPDKNYYLGYQQAYPSLDYERLFSLIQDNTEYATYIDITGALAIEDYYASDIHWKQESLRDVAQVLAKSLGIADSLSGTYYAQEAATAFYGVYRGQSALPLKPDQIRYLTNETTEAATVFNYETGQTTPVYDLPKLDSRDPYDVYLSGASPLLVIDNPLAQESRELIIFRDSFGSSVTPLLLEGYRKITLIDTRYIASDLVGNYVTFTDQDVLFLYNTLLLNSATMLK